MSETFEPTIETKRMDAVTEAFLRDIKESGALPRQITAEAAATVTIGTMLQRIAGGQAEIYRRSLPKPMQELLLPYTSGREETPRRFGRDEYLQRVAASLGISAGEAEPLVNAVLRSMLAHLPMKEVDDVESQLPPELQRLWRQK